MLRKTYDMLYGVARVIVIAVLVLLALYVSLGRNYVGYVSVYREQALTRFNEATGLEMQAGQVIGRWSGLSPVIEIMDFKMAGAAGTAPAVLARKIEVELDVISSVLNRRPEIRHADIDGLELLLEQSESQRWGLAGFAAGEGGLPPWIVDSLLAVRFADVRDARAELLFRGGGRTEMSLPTAQFSGDGYFRRIVVQLALEDSGPVHLIAESEDDPRDFDNFQASTFLQLDQARFGALANVLPPHYAELLKTQASGQLWIRRDENRRVTVSGNLASPEFAAGTFWQRPDQLIHDTKSTFSATYDDKGWSVWFAEAGLSWGEERLQLNDFQVRGKAGDTTLRAHIPKVKVDQLLGILRDGPIPESLDTVLEQLSPQGRLRNVVIGMEIGSADFSSLLATAELVDISLNAWRGAPGARGINGWVEAGVHKGRLLLSTPALALDFPYLYDTPLTLENTRAELIWELTEDSVIVESGVIEARDDGSTIAAMLGLDLPVKPGVDIPRMTLSVGLSDADISARNKYIPKTLSAGLRDWLSDSIGSGRIDHAGFIYHGASGAGQAAERTVQLFTDVRNAALKFHKDWPVATNVNATVLLDDADVRTIGATAKMLKGIDVRKLDVSVRPHRGVSRLFVDATASGDLPAVLNVYRRSPLRDLTGGVFSDWQGSGGVSLDLDLKIPLAGDGAAAEFDVRAALAGNRVDIGGLNLTLNNVKGKLRYSGDTVASESLSGDLFGRPVDIAITQKPGGPVVTTASANVAARSIEQWLSQPVFSLLSGEAAMNVVITTGAERAEVLLQSDLQGIAFDVPAPFTKLKEEKRRLRISMPLRGAQRTMRTEVQGLGNIALQYHEGEIDGIAVTLGHSDQLAVGYPHAVTISGAINGTELMPWKDVLDRFTAASDAHAKSSVAKEGEPWQVRVENFGIGALDVSGLLVEELVVSALSGTAADERWEVDIAGPSVIGRLLLPLSEDQPLDIKLQRLLLPAELLAADETAPKPAATERFDPASLPLVDFYAGGIMLGDDELGSLGFQLRPAEGAAMLRNIRGNIRGVLVSGADLIWTGAISGRDESTEFSGNLTVPNLGDTLEAFHYERVVEAKNTRANVSLKWPGGPDQFDMIASDGFFGIATGKGRLPSSPETATGALRIVGIFNLTNLIRRMQFDFSDLFEKGIAFDSMKGRITLEDGIMSLPGGFEMKGPSSGFVLTGDVNFNNDQTDMQLVATLPVASNLPWVAALVGGLPAAAGVYVASKLFEKQVDRFSSAVYDISGPWQDPQLKFKRVFDDTPPAGSE